jgi:hypothetical protein
VLRRLGGNQNSNHSSFPVDSFKQARYGDVSTQSETTPPPRVTSSQHNSILQRFKNSMGTRFNFSNNSNTSRQENGHIPISSYHALFEPTLTDTSSTTGSNENTTPLEEDIEEAIRRSLETQVDERKENEAAPIKEAIRNALDELKGAKNNKEKDVALKVVRNVIPKRDEISSSTSYDDLFDWLANNFWTDFYSANNGEYGILLLETLTEDEKEAFLSGDQTISTRNPERPYNNRILDFNETFSNKLLKILDLPPLPENYGRGHH